MTKPIAAKPIAAKPTAAKLVEAAAPLKPAVAVSVASVVAKPAPLSKPVHAARPDIAKPQLRPVEMAQTEAAEVHAAVTEPAKTKATPSEMEKPDGGKAGGPRPVGSNSGAVGKPALSGPSPRSRDASPAPAPLAPALFAAPTAMAEPLRKLADTGLTQARDAYATVKGSTERLTSGVDQSSQAAAKGMQAFGASLLEAMQANADAAFGFIKAMTSVKSLSEAVELQSRHARTQFEAMTTQAKELTGIVNRTASAASEPVRKALDESFRKAP